MGVIYAGGSKDVTVPAGQKIEIAAQYGAAQVYTMRGGFGRPAIPVPLAELTRETQRFGIYDVDVTLRIEADAGNVYYDTGDSPEADALPVNVRNSLAVTVGTTGDYATLKDALDDVEFWNISRNATLTISVAEGVYTSTVPIDIETLNGGRINVSCATPETLVFSSLVSITSNGTADHDVVWQVSSAANCKVNDWVVVRSLSGTGDYKALEGFLQITAVDTGTNRITVKVKDRRTSIGACTVSAATMKRMKVIFQFNGCVGFISRGTFGEGSSSGTGIRNAGIVGNGTVFTGVLVEYGAHLDLVGECGIAGFGSHGINAFYGASVSALNACITGCGSNGVYALNNSVIQFVRGVATGNDGSGIVASVCSTVASSQANASGNLRGVFAAGCSEVVFATGTSTGNATDQFLAEHASHINATSAVVVSSSVYGIRARFNSDIDFSGGTISGSSTYDIYAEFKSFVYVSGSTYGTLSPALETEGNMGSLISNDTLAGNNLSVAGTRNFLDYITILTPASAMHAATKAYVDAGDSHLPLVNYGGMNFNGTTTYLDGNALTGIADSKVGTIFALVRFANAASATEALLWSAGDAFRFYRTSVGNIQIVAENAAGTGIMSIAGGGNVLASAGTYLIQASFDLAASGSARIYVNDVSLSVTQAIFTNDTIDYTVAEYSVGATDSGGSKFSGDMYALWFDPTAWTELNTEANRRKFYDKSLVPTFLGPNGSLPTGSPPALFLGYGNSGTWDNNRGLFASTAFVRNGTIADATTPLYGQYMPLATSVSTPPRVVTAAGAVTVGASDHVIVVNKSSGAATTVNLPASPTTGRTLVIKDGKGDANTNNITLTPAAGNIDGAATFVMNVAYQAAKIIYNGTQWNVI